MTFFNLITILIALAALSSYVNFRYVRLPTTIGVMLMSMLGSIALIVAGQWFPSLHAAARDVVVRIDFRGAVLDGMLPFLLFAGALHVDVGDLRREWGLIALLALGGTLASTFLIAGLSYAAFAALGVGLPWIYCVLFGTLISPTDPIAVLAIMKGAGAPRRLETQIAGESLFNDGIGVVLFLTALGIATAGGGGGGHGAAPSGPGLALLLVKEVVGGAAVGLVAGGLVYQMLRRVDNYQVEVLLTLALAMGDYALAAALGVSAPIAAVVGGLLTGNVGRSFAMSEQTERYVDGFWELVDEILNAVLFLLLGLGVLVMPAAPRWAFAGVAAVGITLAARWASVAAMLGLARPWRPAPRGTVAVLTWGGLRGGLSIAMALSLPRDDPQGRFLVVMAYCVVAFSVLVQGTTVGRLIRRVVPPAPAERNEAFAAG